MNFSCRGFIRSPPFYHKRYNSRKLPFLQDSKANLGLAPADSL